VIVAEITTYSNESIMMTLTLTLLKCRTVTTQMKAKDKPNPFSWYCLIFSLLSWRYCLRAKQTIWFSIFLTSEIWHFFWSSVELDNAIKIAGFNPLASLMPGQHLQLMVNRQKLPISSGVILIGNDLNKVKSQFHCGAWSPYKYDRKGLAGHKKPTRKSTGKRP